MGEASYLDGVDSSNIYGFDVCGVDKIGVAGFELAFLSRDEPLGFELLSCYSPSASSWVLQKVKVIRM